MNIKITGDLVINNDYDINPKLKSIFNDSDLNIVNLEGPVTCTTSKILKTGRHIKSDLKSTQQVFKELKVDLATLANNHILDYGNEGLEDTLKFCKLNHVSTVGGGTNLENASKTYYFESKGIKIGIVNFAENEWASATENTSGAHPMDLIENAKRIKNSKAKADFVFVIIHGGHEYYNLPSPRMQKQYRYFVESGADLVVGHHTHCISGFEVYNEVPIFYSLGNFLFTSDSKYDDWYTGLVLEVDIVNNRISTKLHPIQLEKGTFRLSLLTNNKKISVLNKVSIYSKIISDKSELKREWAKFVESNYHDYLNRWSLFAFIEARYIKAVLRRLSFTGINKRGITRYLNLMRCEAHADLSKEITQKYLLRK